MAFKPMDPDEIRKMIEGVEDVITPAVKAEAEMFELIRCPTCGHTGADPIQMPPKVALTPDGPEIVQSPFSSKSPIARSYAKCQGCEVVYDPHSGLIVKADHPILTGVSR